MNETKLSDRWIANHSMSVMTNHTLTSAKINHPEGGVVECPTLQVGLHQRDDSEDQWLEEIEKTPCGSEVVISFSRLVKGVWENQATRRFLKKGGGWYPGKKIPIRRDGDPNPILVGSFEELDAVLAPNSTEFYRPFPRRRLTWDEYATRRLQLEEAVRRT